MDITLRIILCVIAVIGVGFSIGYMIYGIIEEDASDVTTYAALALSLFIALFVGANYEWYLVKTIKMPPAFVDVCNIVDPDLIESLKVENNPDIIDYVEYDDGSIEVSMMLWNYFLRKKNADKAIQDYIYSYWWLDGPGIARVEFKLPYREMEIGVYLTSLDEDMVRGAVLILADFGKVYRYMYNAEENPTVIVRIYDEMTGKLIEEGEV